MPAATTPAVTSLTRTRHLVLPTQSVSSNALVWASAGVLLASAYTLEWVGFIHSDLGFALAWGGFPLLAGYWAQTESFSIAAGLAAGAAVMLSLAQRALSTPARFVRRQATDVNVVFSPAGQWNRHRLLRTWETPLKLLAATTIILALALLSTHA